MHAGQVANLLLVERKDEHIWAVRENPSSRHEVVFLEPVVRGQCEPLNPCAMMNIIK